MNQPDIPLPQQYARRALIIEGLEMAASFAEQLRYQEAVPIADVPSEVLHGWCDLVQPDTIDADCPNPIYTEAERTAMHAFQAVWVGVVRDLPPASQRRLTDLQASQPWQRLREGAERTLLALMAHGGRTAGD